MKRRITSRISVVLLSLAVLISFTVVVPQETYAASNTKTFYVETQISSSDVFTSSYGSNDKDSYKTTYTYGKNGLLTASKNQSGEKTVYTRNKAGYPTKVKSYGKDGKLTGETVFKRNKNGDVTSTTAYVYNNGKKTKDYTATFTYYGKGKQKTSTYKYTDSSYTSNYNKKGLRQKV